MHQPTKDTKIVASEETVGLARQRGYELGRPSTDDHGVDLVDSGHILGSRGLLIDGETFYTGDFSSRGRAFLAGAQPLKCRTLIIESTYGRADYHFPPTKAVIESAQRLIGQLFDRGVPGVLLGYPLGKAQLLSHYFSSWAPVYLHEAVERMNQAHRDLGIPLGEAFRTLPADHESTLGRGPWLLIAPTQHGRSEFVRTLKARFGVVTIGFTGWALESTYQLARGLDHALPLSDHCDFAELLAFVKECAPEKVYVVHGFAAEFAAQLRRLGYDAVALNGPQRFLSEYVRED
jgi:putative mRNA 3-end processing factor